MRICLTGGIASGKSLLSAYLNDLGIETIDADDIVHSLIPAEERKRLAGIVFGNPAARRALEAKVHPLVKERVLEFLDEDVAQRARDGRIGSGRRLRVAVIPLLFEVHWEREFDIICCVVSARERQLERLTTTRGMSREEAESRIAAQLPAEEKAAKSHYVIRNDGTAEDLRIQAAAFVRWLEGR